MNTVTSNPTNNTANIIALMMIIGSVLTVPFWIFCSIAETHFSFLSILIASNVFFVSAGLLNQAKIESVKLIAILGTIGFSLLLVLLVVSPKEKNSSGVQQGNSGATTDNSGVACACAQDRVTNLLKSPSTADFPSGCDRFVTDLGGNRYTVTSYVDAENGFGAMIRSNYTCDVTVTSSWECNANCNLL